MNNQTALTQLLQSKSTASKLLGFSVALLLFFPTVCEVADDPNLSVWQRVKQLSLAASQTLLTLSLAALKPETFTDTKGDEQV